jgi:Sulfotransferase family
MTTSADAPVPRGDSREHAGARTAEPAAHAPGALAAARERGRVPDFFIVGHPKSGTTALFRMLSRHPQLFMPMKEPRFLAPARRSGLQRFGPGRIPQTVEEYTSLFAGARPSQLVGEASPTYLRSSVAAAAIAELQPAARIIAILREPASFLRSLHLQFVHNYTETQKDLRKALALEDARRRGKRIPIFTPSARGLLYSDHVKYVEQLRRYHDLFAPERVLVLIYDDFRRDNAATVRQVLRFLEVDDRELIEPTETEPLRGIRFLYLHQLTRVVSVAHRNPNARSPLLRATNLLVPKGLRSERFQAAWNRLVYSDPDRVDEQLMLELRRRFEPEVVALSEYLGRDLVTLWGYDRIH